MSNQSGVQLYGQSMNGLLELSNVQTIECYELDAEIINVDNLTVNNSLTVPNISNTTIGTITQSGTNIITQTGSGTNVLKNTDISGNLYVSNNVDISGNLYVSNNVDISGNLYVSNNVDISGNLTISGIVTYDMVDIDCENLIVRNDTSLNDVNVSGVLTMGSSLTSIINQPSKTAGAGTPVTPNHLSLTFIQEVRVEETLDVYGYAFFRNNMTQFVDSFNTLRGQTEILGTLYTPNTTVRGTLTQTDAYIISQSGTGNNILKNITQSGTNIISQSGTGNNLLKSINQTGGDYISQTGTGTNTLKNITQTGSNIITQNGTGFNLLKSINQTGADYISQTGTGTNTLKNITQTGSSIISQPSGSGTNLLKDTIINNNLTVNNLLTVPNISNTTIGTITQTGANIITQTGLGLNILKNTEINGNFIVDNVADFLPNTDVETYIFDEELLTDVVASTATEITFFTFKVRGTTQTKNFLINLSFPLSNFQTGTQNISPNTVTNTLFGASNQQFVLRRNGVVVSYTTPSYTNGGTKSYSITGTGAFTYQQYLSMFSCVIPFTEGGLGVFYRTYTVGVALTSSVIIPTPARINPSTFKYKINTTITGFTATGGLVTNLNGLYTDYAVGSYSITQTDFVEPTTLYTNYAGTLVNNSLVNNNLFNRAEFNNLYYITYTPYELFTINSYYMISKTGDTQINLPYFTNNFTGFTVNIRKASPSSNSDAITINASVNGCLYYPNNMTPTNANIRYSSSVSWTLLYAGDGNWYLLNII
jgi:cytoskeletal protein CcmA (bactofilin family)